MLMLSELVLGDFVYYELSFRAARGAIAHCMGLCFDASSTSCPAVPPLRIFWGRSLTELDWRVICSIIHFWVLVEVLLLARSVTTTKLTSGPGF